MVLKYRTRFLRSSATPSKDFIARRHSVQDPRRFPQASHESASDRHLCVLVTRIIIQRLRPPRTTMSRSSTHGRYGPHTLRRYPTDHSYAALRLEGFSKQRRRPPRSMPSICSQFPSTQLIHAESPCLFAHNLCSAGLRVVLRNLGYDSTVRGPVNGVSIPMRDCLGVPDCASLYLAQMSAQPILGRRLVAGAIAASISDNRIDSAKTTCKCHNWRFIFAEVRRLSISHRRDSVLRAKSAQRSKHCAGMGILSAIIEI
ncbi:hypothetical protein C8Q80DRAFT_191894 [Daedaleopsis nitida]|nr:hypothetical protein C8Q80DRAFT_191894 [Daedaleopsis nitida]